MMNQSHIYTLLSLSSSFIAVYPKMRDAVEESDTPKSINFRLAMLRGGWFSKHYLPERRSAGLKVTLKALSESYLKHSGATKAAINLESNMYREVTKQKGIGGNRHFMMLEDLLPEILADLALTAPLHAFSLNMLSKRLRNEAERTYAAIEKAFDDAKRAEEEPQAEKSLLGAQNAAVESAINAVLQTLDKKIAHSIRTVLAKSDNKLATLQQELTNLGL